MLMFNSFSIGTGRLLKKIFFNSNPGKAKNLLIKNKEYEKGLLSFMFSFSVYTI